MWREGSKRPTGCDVTHCLYNNIVRKLACLFTLADLIHRTWFFDNTITDYVQPKSRVKSHYCQNLIEGQKTVEFWYRSSWTQTWPTLLQSHLELEVVNAVNCPTYVEGTAPALKHSRSSCWYWLNSDDVTSKTQQPQCEQWHDVGETFKARVLLKLRGGCSVWFNKRDHDQNICRALGVVGACMRRLVLENPFASRLQLNGLTFLKFSRCQCTWGDSGQWRPP